MPAATACAARRSAAARLADTPRIANVRPGPSARVARASSTDESTPPEKATPKRAGSPNDAVTRSANAVAAGLSSVVLMGVSWVRSPIGEVVSAIKQRPRSLAKPLPSVAAA